MTDSSKIDRLHVAGKVPLVVGGTAYYATALVFEDLLPGSSGPRPDERQEVDVRLEKGTEELYADLQHVDPVMATRWHPKDHRKIRRSLEIFYTTGRRQSELYSEQREQGRLGPANVKYRTLFLWLWSEQSVLDKRLDARIDEMIASGLFEEIRAMHDLQSPSDAPPDVTRGIYQAIGYKEFLKYLDSGREVDRVAGTEAMKGATRRYARRQIKWIRNKLLLQCREAGEDVQIVLLDATDLFKWTENVREQGLRAVKDFLSTSSDCPRTADVQFCAEMYSPSTLRALLNPKVEKEFSANPEAWEKFVCEHCPGFSTNSREGREQHLQSNGHRAKLKQDKKRREYQAWKKAQAQIKAGGASSSGTASTAASTSIASSPDSGPEMVSSNASLVDEEVE